jgi:hypothetical protein
MTEQEHGQVVRILAGMIGDWQARETLRRRAVEELSDEEPPGSLNLKGSRES